VIARDRGRRSGTGGWRSGHVVAGRGEDLDRTPDRRLRVSLEFACAGVVNQNGVLE
jgi:hypothetical protein